MALPAIPGWRLLAVLMLAYLALYWTIDFSWRHGWIGQSWDPNGFDVAFYAASIVIAGFCGTLLALALGVLP